MIIPRTKKINKLQAEEGISICNVTNGINNVNLHIQPNRTKPRKILIKVTHQKYAQQTIRARWSPIIYKVLYDFHKLILISILFFFPGYSFSQKHGSELIDSLKSRIPNATEDTVKISLLARLSFEYFGFDTDLGINYGEEALALSEKIGWNKGIALSYNSLGANWAIKSNYPKSLECYTKSLAKYTETGDKQNIANSLNNIGWLYINQKEYNKAYDFLNQSLKINTELNYIRGIANNYANLGICYNKQGNYAKANEYYYKVLAVHQQLNNRTSVSVDLSNISKNKMRMKEYCEALEVGFQGLKNSEEINNTYCQALLNRIIGEIYLQIASDSDSRKNIKCRYYLNNKYENLFNAKKHLFTAFTLFDTINDLSSISESSNLLSVVYEQLGDFNNALAYYKKYTVNKDSIFSRDNSIKIINIEKKREIDLRDKQILIQQLEIRNKARLFYLLLAIIFIIILISGMFLSMYFSKRKANRQLEEKNKIISEINNQKDKFFSIIAHDLRSPFNSFLGLTQIIAERLPALTMDEIQMYAVRMRNSANNLFRLLENLLQWARIQQGLIPYNPKVVKLLPVVNDSISIMLESANDKGIELTIDIPEDLCVFADNNIIQTVIRNLVSNAVKFTPKGGNIRLSTKVSEDKSIEIAVIDSGIGMSNEMIEQLFRLDIQTNRKGTAGEPSSGLGLYLCKDLVEKHGGKIWVESKEGIGSIFYFSIPYNDQLELKNITVGTDSSGSNETIPKDLTILIAEDDQQSELFLTLVVEKLSKEILKARTGIETVDIFLNNPDIDLILMDVKMPEMDGYEATRQIRKFNTKVVIIAQTAYALNNEREKAIEAGCNDYISKPVNMKKLKALIHNHFINKDEFC